MENKSIAIFIDAENIPAKYAKSIFDIASDYGEVIIKRIYGDWTQKNIQGWREQIAEYLCNNLILQPTKTQAICI